MYLQHLLKNIKSNVRAVRLVKKNFATRYSIEVFIEVIYKKYQTANHCKGFLNIGAKALANISPGKIAIIPTMVEARFIRRVTKAIFDGVFFSSECQLTGGFV